MKNEPTSKRIALRRRSRAFAALGAIGTLVLAYACTLTDVTGVPVGSVTISPLTINLVEGARLQISAQAKDELGNPLPLGGLTWSVGDPNLLSISEAGFVEALSAGETTVRATLAGVSGTAPVVIEPGPTITVGTPSISFVGAVGPTPPDPAVVQITNTGGGVLGGLNASVTYAAGGPTGWLNPSLSGTTAPTNLTVSVLSGSLGQGSYSATISLTSSVARNSPVTIPVQLDLTLDQPLIAVDPVTVLFELEEGAGPPPAKVVQITNAGGGTLTSLQTLLGSGSWLSAVLSATDAPTQLNLQPNPQGLSAGTYNETVLVRSDVALNQEEVAVTLRIIEAPEADLSVGKTGPNGATVGDTVIFVLTATNAGPENAREATLVDSLPTGLTFMKATGNPTVEGRRIVWDLGSVPPGTPSVDSVWVLATEEGTVNNLALVSSTSDDADMGNNRAVHPVQVVPVAANLLVEKTGPATADFGDVVQYQIRVLNGGPNAAEQVALIDSLPTGTNFVSAAGGGTLTGSAVTWSVGRLEAGGEFVTTISLEVAAAGSLTDVARVNSVTFDPVPGNNRNTATTGVGSLADLAIEKTVSPSGIRRVGEALTYDLRVTNNGPSDAANVVVSDELPAGVAFASASGNWNELGGVVTWDTIPTLASGADTVLTVIVTIQQVGTLRNTARVTSPFVDPDPSNNEDIVDTVADPSADLTITKTATYDGDGSPVLGGQVTYELIVENTGPNPATDIEVSDTLPAEVTYVSDDGLGTHSAGVVTWPLIPTLAVGAADTVHLVATIDQNVAFANVGAVTAATYDRDLTNNADSAQTVPGASADLSMEKTGDAGATGGGQATYTVTVTNNGPSEATNVLVTDILPAGVSFSSASLGGTETAPGIVTWPALASLASLANQPYTVTVDVAPGTLGVVTDTAFVSAATTDLTPANDTATFNTTVSGSADVSVSKVVTSPITAGGQATYTLTVSNAGPSNAVNVVVADTLPVGTSYSTATPAPATIVGRTVTWTTIGTLAPGASQQFTVTVDVSPGTTGSITNKATAIATTPDPTPGNNVTSLTTAVQVSADVEMSKTGPPTAVPGNNVTYTLSVQNLGPSDATGVVVTDPLPASVTYVSSPGATYDAPSRTLTWNRGSLEVIDGLQSINLTVTIGAVSGQVTNTASLTSTSADPVAANDGAFWPISVGGADVQLTKVVDLSSANPGNRLTYTVTAENVGPSVAEDVVIRDSLPVGVTFVSATGGPTQSGRQLQWPSIATIAIGASSVYTIEVDVNGGAIGVLENMAKRFSSTSTDFVPSNDRATATTALVSAAQSTATVPSGVAGSSTFITIQANDVNGDALSTGGSTVTVTVSGSNTAGPITATDNGDGTYSASYTPTTAGTDNVAITLGGAAISGSPYSSTVSAGAAVAGNSTATVPAGTAGSATTITVQAKDANLNDLAVGGSTVVVTVSGSNTAGPTTATDNGDGTYTASYTPTSVGTDNVAITLGGVAISSSPYSSVVSPGAASAGNSTATVPAGTAGSATSITVQAKDSNDNDLSVGGSTVVVTVSGSNTAGPTTATDNGDGTYTASYTPTTAGSDNVAITLGGVAISGSPYSSAVSAGAASAANSTATVPNGSASSPTTITVQAKDANDNDLSVGGSTVVVTVSGSNTAGPTTATDNGDGTYTASYTPTAVGTDNVAITLGGVAISGSPYPSAVTTGGAVASQSTATVPAGTAGSATTITVQARDGGGNALSTGGETVVVTVSGSNTAGPTTATDNGDGTYTASYTPTSVGTDNVAITLGGVAISSSPYTSVVSPGAASAANSTATVPGGTAGSATSITVQAKDSNNNDLSVGGSTVVVTVSGSNTAGPTTATDNGDGTYTASYTPTTAGSDNVAITLGGVAISGSPYSSAVSAGAVSAANSTATVPNGSASSPTTITVQAKDANDNDLSVGGSTVVVTVSGSNTAGPTTATDNGDGTYTASYTPTAVGTDNVAITLGGVAISGSPYTSTVTTGGAVASQSTATVPAGTAGSATTITVQARDGGGNALSTGGETVVVTVSGSNTAGPTTATDNGDGTYTASYTPTSVGTDNVAITLGGVAISSSPYTSVVSPGAASAANSTATVPGGTAGSATSITVQAKDSNDNDLSVGGSTVVVTVSGSNTAGPTTATDNGDGTYTASYTPTTAGSDNVAITLGGVAISGSPYSSAVSAGAVSAANSTATVPNGSASSPTTITVQAKDANDNDLSVGGSTVVVTVSGSNTAGPTTATDNGDGTYTASYTPTAVGTDNVAITLGGVAISGSPYTSTVTTGGAVAAQSTATVPAGTAGSATSITVQARDGGGNDLSTGGETVVVTVSGSNTAGPTTATDNGDGTYTTSYTPTSVGTDNVAITLGGVAISGSPYSSVVSVGPVSAGNSTAAVPAGTAGSSTTITVQAKDANDNDLSVGGSTVVVSVSGSNTAGPTTATDNGDGTYTASYTPTTAGTDNVAITLGGVAISGSPYSSAVSAGAASAANSTATVPNGSASSPTTITVQAKDANDNDLSVGGSTVVAAVSGDNTAGPLTATDNGDGTYTIIYTPTAVGTDNVAITLGGLAISGSPYTSTVTTGGAVASQSTATVPAGTAGSATTITVQARDGGGNDLSTGGSSVVVTVSGSNTAGPTTATDNGDGTYTTSYTPITAGTDNVAITLGGVAIGGSPYSSTVSPGAANAPRTVATFPTGSAGSPTDITIQARDANDNDLTIGGATVVVTISGSNAAGPITATDNSNGTYTASYTPTLTGTDDAAITLGGGTIRNSPYSATVNAGAASAGNSTATVPDGTAGSATSVTIQAKDANNNDLAVGGSTVVITVSGDNTAGPITATDNTNGTYSATYTPTSTGTDNVAITLDGDAISSSPYSSTVGAGPASAGNSTASVPAGTAGTLTTIVVQAKDANGNDLSMGGSSVIVTVTGANLLAPTMASDNVDGTYSVSYTPLVSGTDNVAITLDGGTISGSPYSSTVSPGPVSATNSTANVPNGSVGNPTTITVQAKDANNNNLSVGGATVVVTITGDNPGTPAVVDNNDGTYTASYSPTTAGTDTVPITLGGVAIFGSPYTSSVSASPSEGPVL